MARPGDNHPPTLEFLAPGDLIPYIRNSRAHSEAQVAQIAGSIREFGFLSPVVIGPDNGILAGHARILAAFKLGLEQVPCVRAEHLTESQRRAYIIADNRLAELATWDRDMLALELGDLKDVEFSIEVVGFTDDDLDALRGSLEDGFDESQPDGTEQREPYDTMLTLGPYRVPVERDKFTRWEEQIRATVGFEKDAILAEMARRMGL